MTHAARLLSRPKSVVLTLRGLVLCGLVMLGVGTGVAHPFLFWFTVVVYGATNLGYAFASAGEFARPRTQSWLFAFDVVAVSLLIVFRGSQVPQFITAYFTLVLMAAVVQGLGSAILNALFVSTLYAAVTAWGMEGGTLLTFPVLSQFAFFFVIAVFMGQVAEWGRQEAKDREKAQVMAGVLETAVAEKTAHLRRSLEELRAARDRLAASDRLATLGTLSAGLGHEIRNPLAAIRAALDEAPALVDELEAAAGHLPDAKEPLALLRSVATDCDEACAHLQRVAQDLTSVARSAPAAAQPVSPLEALEATARLLRHRERDDTRIHLECTATRDVSADPARLQQVLLNLATNGLDAMEGRGGSLTLAAEDADGGAVRFRIGDTGCGMTPEVRDRAFDAFFTTKKPGKGTGLGLHLVREIVTAHGGAVEIDTRLGEGTEFRVTWPAAGKDVEDDHVEAEDPPARRGRRGEHPQGVGADLEARAV